MTTKTFLVMVLTATLSGCSWLINDNYELRVLLNNADGLNTRSAVKLNGIIIGNVSSIRLGEDNEVIATISIDEDNELPVDSRFVLTKDFLGTASIEIKRGRAIEMLNDGQQVKGDQQKVELGGMSADNAMNFLEGLVDTDRKTTQDSILLELRRLNRNVEKLLEKK